MTAICYSNPVHARYAYCSSYNTRYDRDFLQRNSHSKDDDKYKDENSGMTHAGEEQSKHQQSELIGDAMETMACRSQLYQTITYCWFLPLINFYWYYTAMKIKNTIFLRNSEWEDQVTKIKHEKSTGKVYPIDGIYYTILYNRQDLVWPTEHFERLSSLAPTSTTSVKWNTYMHKLKYLLQ